MATVEVSIPAAAVPPAYERVASSSPLRSKRASDVDTDALRATLPADALAGPLQLVLDLPESHVLQHVEPHMRELISGRIEEIARYTAEEDSVYSVTEQLAVLGADANRASLVSAEEEEPVSPPRLNEPSQGLPSLPSFGMGLKRQKSFGCPVTHLTDAEVKVQSELHARCAKALGRLASRFRMGGALVARARAGAAAAAASLVCANPSHEAYGIGPARARRGSCRAWMLAVATDQECTRRRGGIDRARVPGAMPATQSV